MKAPTILALGVLLVLLLPGAAGAQAKRPCQFIRDFKRLHDLAPAQVGQCTSRRIFAANGDVLQYTANGLMVRRASDNWTAFTDGHSTWIDGPNGLASRLNAERFSWEHDPASPSPRLEGERVGPASAYPNAALTPGALDPRVSGQNVKRTICAPGYAAKASPPAEVSASLMRRQMARYGYAGADPAGFEPDQLVPVDLGGDPAAPSNLWPQPIDAPFGAQQKDQLEGYLHAQVCSGGMTLAAAQRAILNDWVAEYQRLPAAA